MVNRGPFKLNIKRKYIQKKKNRSSFLEMKSKRLVTNLAPVSRVHFRENFVIHFEGPEWAVKLQAKEKSSSCFFF